MGVVRGAAADLPYLGNSNFLIRQTAVSLVGVKIRMGVPWRSSPGRAVRMDPVRGY
jgi:hypothetical protein